MLLRSTTLALVLALAASFAHADPANAPAPKRAPQEAKAAADDPLAHERAIFPRPRVLRGNIAFWRKVFAEYSRHQSVIHDIRKPERVYQVLDFRDSVASAGNGLGSLKNSEEEAAKRRIAQLLRETAALIETPDAMSEDQRRLAALFAEEPTALLTAAEFIRAQRGLREQTAEAMKISGQYLPEMERIFEQKGLPKLLTRLPIVESSFNVEAYSKVAAAGLWQFMPSTAKMYMRYNHISDDRKDPWRSTRAAADHLADDYRVLRDWPLAVTAYNYGRGGLVKALREVGGTGLDDLIERFNSPRFGFASRNFYAEFVAATDVERDWREHFEGVERRPAVRFDEVRLPRYTPWATLVRLSGGDEAAFKRLNPAYREVITGGKLYVPAGDVIRVPAGEGERFDAAYASLGSGQTFGSQRQQFFMVKVRKGDSLGAIAHRYGVSERTLKGLNGLKKGRVRAGMRLKVPNLGDVDGEAIEAAAEAAAPVVQAAKAEAPEPEAPSSCNKLKGKKKTACLREQTDASEVAEAPGNCNKLKGKKKSACELRKLASNDEPKAEKPAKAAKARTHTVKAGQNLSTIAKRHGTTAKVLMQLNDLDTPSKIKAGMKLKLPS